MNAYELAGKADELCSTTDSIMWIREAQLVLLKQAKRIEELEKDLQKYDRLAFDDLDESWIDKEKLQQALDADRDRAMDELVKWQQEFEKSAQIIGNKPTSFVKLKEDFE